MMKSHFAKDETPKAYAKNQISEIWDINMFSKHIAAHNGVFSRGTVKGVITDMCECLVEQLLEGRKIELGELGSFVATISCEPAESIEKFSMKNIKAVNILFKPGEEFENLINKTIFNPVASRAAQMATLKAEKAGADSVDLSALKKNNSQTPSVDPEEGGGTL